MDNTAAVYGPPTDSFIVEPNSRWAYNHHGTYTAAVQALGRLMIDDPHRFAKARVVIADRFAMECEQVYLDRPIVEITAERFEDMLDCLPPLDWTRRDGVERFNCREMTYGAVTNQYARYGNRYFCRPVRHRDHATYLPAAVIEQALAAGEVVVDRPDA